MKYIIALLSITISLSSIALSPPISLEAVKTKIESMDSGLVVDNVQAISRSAAIELDIYSDCTELQSRSAQAFTAQVNGRTYLYTTSDKVADLQLCRAL